MPPLILNRRQGLLGGLLGGGHSAPPTPSAPSSGNGGLLGGLNSVLDPITSPLLGGGSVTGPTPTSFFTQATSSASPSPSSSRISSDASSSSAASATAKPSSSPSQTTSSSPSSATPAPSPTTPPPVAASTPALDTGPTTITSTSSVLAALNSSSATPAPVHQSFLENKSVSIPVLTLLGILGLCVLMSAVAFIFRRVHKRRLHNDAIAWPEFNDHASAGGVGAATNLDFDRDQYARQGSLEKGRGSIGSGSEESYGTDGTSVYGYSAGYRNQQGGYPAPPGVTGYAAQQGFFAQSNGQQAAAYRGYAPPAGVPARMLTPQLSVMTGLPSQPPMALPSPVRSVHSTNGGVGDGMGPPRRISLLSGAGPVSRVPSRGLDPAKRPMPAPSPLPDSFGSEDSVAQVKTLKVTNE